MVCMHGFVYYQILTLCVNGMYAWVCVLSDINLVCYYDVIIINNLVGNGSEPQMVLFIPEISVSVTQSK